LSYQVIARKWRPQSFDEVSGQSHVTTALRNAIRSERIPHAMLLTGPRGVGKTTLARLIARCLNCEKGPTDTPCGTCTACVEITEGRSIDVQEIDAASRTGVDDMREVIESIRYAAAPGKHRIYIIDEVHMLSTAAFNALLKTLEEPPPRSLFVLATTNPEKIPFTVLSRCQRHDLRRIALASVTERLAEICAAEGIEISSSALTAIAREGEGSMRDAQTLLDQIIAYSYQGGAEGSYQGGAEGSVRSKAEGSVQGRAEGSVQGRAEGSVQGRAEGSGKGATVGGTRITDETLAEVLDLVDRRIVRGIIETCIDADAKAALEFVAQATSGGSEPRRIADALLELLRDLTVLRIAPDGENLFEGTAEERAELIAMANKTEPARLRRMFRALVREIEDLSWAPQPAAVLEMAVIRLATLPAGDDVAQLLSRLDQLERRLAGGGGEGTSAGSDGGSTSGSGRRSGAKTSGDPGTGGGGTRPRSRKGSTSPAAAEREAGDDEPEPKSTPVASPTTPQTTPPTTPQNTPQNTPATPPTFAPPPTLGGGAPPAAIFDRFRARAMEQGRSKFASLENASLIAIRGDTMVLGVHGSFHADRLRKRCTELEAIASELFAEPARISVEQIDAQNETEVGLELREMIRRRRQEALNSEPVNLALEILEAEIVEIRPFGEHR
jgi:DNA polymerase-3 subunit gamma/tau